MTDFQVAGIAAVAAHPDRNDGRDFSLVVIERVFEDEEGGERVDVLTLGPNSRRLEGLPTFDSREDLEEAALEHKHLLEKAQGENHPLGPIDPVSGRRRAVEFNDLVDWKNGVYPVADTVTEPDAVKPAKQGRRAGPAKKAAPAAAG
jgi:hypothetical protein